MAYINVNDWKCEQVIEWIKGLDNSMNLYIQSFLNNQIGGRQLLDIRASELEQLGVDKIGHQEIILEAVEHLKNFHYNLDKENLQYLALQVFTTSTCLYKQLIHNSDKNEIETNILTDVTTTISKILPLVNWLDRAPFQGQIQYFELRTNILRLGLELSTSAQRDRFVENPVEHIKNTAKKLSKLAEYVIKDISDPMLLCPSHLDIITLKKKEADLGFYIVPNYHFIHRISEIKYNSAAHNSGKIEEGDEIMQINYQTVVGWQYKKVLMQLQESPTDVLLTLRKRPRHTKIYGQIYLIKLPSKKRSLPYRWDNMPSPRITMQDFLMPLPYPPEKSFSSSDSDSSIENVPLTLDESTEKDKRLFLPKPRAVLQRRHTIAGDDLSNLKNIGNVVIWHERKSKNAAESPSLRDKCVSFGYGLEIAARPTTCIGIKEDLKSNSDTLKSNIEKMHGDSNFENPNKGGVSKVVKFDSNLKLEEYKHNHDSKFICNVEDTIIETFSPIPFADEDSPPSINQATSNTTDIPKVKETVNTQKIESSILKNSNINTGVIEAVNTVLVEREIRRGKLDKSHSAPAYDNGSDDNADDAPPAVKPKEQLKKAPVPPPRPKKTHQLNFSYGSGTLEREEKKPPAIPDVKGKLVHEIEVRRISNVQIPQSPKELVQLSSSLPTETSSVEVFTGNKTKTLTMKKKSSLLSKRRKISLKSLSNSLEIQGFLYRRTKDKTGVTYWAKYYFVLMDTALYGFKKKESKKADCLIFLSGFTVSLAKEVHSKQYAFKVYHPSKTFYFASETYDALLQWTEYIKQAINRGMASITSTLETDPKNLYSETDLSEDENDNPNDSGMMNDSEKSLKDFDTSVSSRLNLGSLRKLAKNSSNLIDSPDNKFLGFFTSHKSNDKRAPNDVPIPTSQFRTYRKVPNNGQPIVNISPSANNVSSPSVEKINQIPVNQNKPDILSRNCDSFRDIKNTKLSNKSDASEYKLKNHKKSPHNYLHASNPNLVDFEFHYPKANDFSIPKLNSSNHNNWDAFTHSNNQNFVTLKDLMLQKQEEEARDMYDKRVFMGFEKSCDVDKLLQKKCPKPSEKIVEKPKSSDPHIQKIQKRSLPITPDYAQSFKPDDHDILYTRSKEGQKLRDFGYEMILGEDAQDDFGRSLNDKNWCSKRTDKIVPTYADSLRKKSLNWICSNDESQACFSGATSSMESQKKSKKKLDIKIGSSSTKKLSMKSASFGKSSDKEKPEPQKKSSSTNYFAKISNSKSSKEKKLLGSPRLHRALFGKSLHSSSSMNANHEMLFSKGDKFSHLHSDTDSHKSDSQNDAFMNAGEYPDADGSSINEPSNEPHLMLNRKHCNN